MIDVPENPRKRSRNGLSDYPCLICGASVNPSTAVWVRVHCGGSCICTLKEAETMNREAGNDGADLYYHPIGPDCRRRHPELEPYIQDAKSVSDAIRASMKS